MSRSFPDTKKEKENLRDDPTNSKAYRLQQNLQKFRSIVRKIMKTASSTNVANKKFLPKLGYYYEIDDAHFVKDNAKKLVDMWRKASFDPSPSPVDLSSEESENALGNEFVPSINFDTVVEYGLHRLDNVSDEAKKSFNEYIKLLEIRRQNGLLDPEIAALLEPRVKYLSKEEREEVRLHFGQDGLIYRGDERDEENKAIPYHTIGHSDGFVRDSADNIIKKSNSPNDAAFVVMDGKIYAKHHITGVFQHSSLAGGKSVKCAGVVQVENGKFTKFLNKSGHYRTHSSVFRDHVVSILEQHPGHASPNILFVDIFQPCYFDPVLHSGTNFFIHKFGEELLSQFYELKEYKSIEAFKEAEFQYKWEIDDNTVDQKIQSAIDQTIKAQESKLLPGETLPAFNQTAIISTTKQILYIQQIILNSQLPEDKKKILRDQLANIFHLKLESIAGDQEIGKLSQDALKIFYETTVNNIEDLELRGNLRSEIQKLYDPTNMSYVTRSPDLPPLQIITSSLSEESPDITKLQECMIGMIRKMEGDKSHDFKDLSNLFLELYNLGQYAETDDNSFILKSIWNEKRQSIIGQIRSHPKIDKFTPDIEDMKILSQPIFYAQYKKDSRSDLVEIFSHQVESIRMANLRHIARTGSPIDQTFQIGGKSSDSGANSADQIDNNIRLQAAWEVIENSLSPQYLEDIFNNSTQNMESGSNRITIIRPIKDDNMSYQSNFLAKLSATVLAKKLNELSRARGENFIFEAAAYETLAPTSSDQDLLDLLIKEGSGLNTKDIANRNLIIFNDHLETGSSLTTLANFARLHNAKILCAVSLTSCQDSSESIYASNEVIEFLKKYIRDDDVTGRKFLPQDQALDNLENLLKRQGLSISTITNKEALMLIALFMDSSKADELKSFKDLIANDTLISKSEIDFLEIYLSKQKKPYTVRTLGAEIKRRLHAGTRISAKNIRENLSSSSPAHLNNLRYISKSRDKEQTRH